MNHDSLLYGLSTIPQVIAALAALVSAFSPFRIQSLRDHLIGHGKSVLNRWDDPKYGLPGERDEARQKARLRDSIDRRSIADIKQVLVRLAEHEAAQGHTVADRPRGFRYLIDRYSATEDLINALQKWTARTLGAAFVSIIVSVGALGWSHTISEAGLARPVFLVALLVMICTLVPIWRLVSLSLGESREEVWDND